MEQSLFGSTETGSESREMHYREKCIEFWWMLYYLEKRYVNFSNYDACFYTNFSSFPAVW